MHDYHFGYTEMNYNDENKSIETSIKLYIDDLDLALSTLNNASPKLNTDEEIELSDALIEAYIKENFNLEINQKEKEATFIGREYEDDVVWIYLEYNGIRKIKELKVTNSLLFDTFDDQKNLFNIKILGKTYSPTLKKRSPSYNKRF